MAASQADVLKLVASLTDNVSGPMGKIKRSYQDFVGYSTKGYKDVTAYAQKHSFALQDMRKAMEGASDHIKKVLTPAMSGLGIAAVSLGGAIAAVTKAAKDFGDTSIHLKRLSEETHLAKTSLMAFEQAAVRYGSTAEAADAGFQTFAKNMEQWAAGRGAVVEAMKGERPEIQALFKELQGKPTETAFGMVIKDLDKINTIQGKKTFLSKLGLDPAFAYATKKDLDEIIAKVPHLSAAQEKAGQAAWLSWARAWESLQNFSYSMGAELAPVIKDIADAFRKFIEDNGADFTQWLKGVVEGIRDFDWKGWGTTIKGIVDSLGGWGHVLEGLVGIGFAAWLAPIAASIVLIGAAIAPVLGPLALLAGALTLAYEAYQHWQDIKDYFSQGKFLSPEGRKALGYAPLEGDVKQTPRPQGHPKASDAEPSVVGGPTLGAPTIPTPGVRTNPSTIGGQYALATEVTAKTMLFSVLHIEKMFELFSGGGSGTGGGTGPAGAAGGGKFGAGTPATGGIGGGGSPDVTSDKGSTPGTFNEKAPGITKKLMDKYGLTKEQASGIVGNLGEESAGFTQYHEAGKPADKGGVGWAQWTGSRRKSFEAWTQSHGLDPRSDEASYRYLTEGDPQTAAAIAAVKQQSTVSGSMQAWEKSFEGAGKPAWEVRQRYAEKAFQLGMGNGSGSPSTPGGTNPADMGASLVGMKDHQADGKKFINDFLGKGNSGANVGRDWCADFVSASVKAAGQGNGAGAIASAWAGWGEKVAKDDIRKGDVVVNRNRKGGLAIGQQGGHVAIATGPAVGGRIPVIEGDVRAPGGGHMVTYGTESINDDVRRGHAGGQHTSSLGGTNLVTRMAAIEHKVKGEANMHIHLKGFPKQTNTYASADGIFKSVQVHRGKQNQLAEG